MPSAGTSRRRTASEFWLALLASSTKFADEALDAALTFVRAVASQNGADLAAVKRAAKDLAKRV